MKNQLIGLLLLIMFTGCYTKKQAIDKFCRQDSSTFKGTILAPITTIVPPDTTKFILKISELQSALNKLDDLYRRQSDSIITLYSDSLHEVTIQIDITKPIPTSKWQIRDKNPKVIHDTIPVNVEVKVPCNCPPMPEPTFWDKVKDLLAVFGILALLIGFAVLVLWRK